MKPHYLYVEDDFGKDTEIVLASIHPASPEAVKDVLSQPDKGPDGRSPWVWIRLQNGDLALATFPQGETYFRCERDAQYPE